MYKNVSNGVNISLHRAAQKEPRIHPVNHRASSGNSSPQISSFTRVVPVQLSKDEAGLRETHRGQWPREHPQPQAGPRACRDSSAALRPGLCCQGLIGQFNFVHVVFFDGKALLVREDVLH